MAMKMKEASHTDIRLYINASYILSQLDGELLEIPDSPIDQLPSSLSPAISTATATKPRPYSKVWLHTPVGRKDVILTKEGKSIWRSNIAEAFKKAQQAPGYKRRRLSGRELDPALVERWITTCGISFRMATLPEFRAFLHYLNPEIDNWLPNSITTIRAWTFGISKLKRNVSKVKFNWRSLRFTLQ
ncbi:hypothetical protein V1505DRAFT_423493 [Lipomyces doorenjongii]